MDNKAAETYLMETAETRGKARVARVIHIGESILVRLQRRKQGYTIETNI